MTLILASASPRRSLILQQAGIPFTVVASRIDEELPGLPPGELVRQLALRKARAVAGRFESGIVLGADTVVLHSGEVLGKPRTREEARQMLQRLSGEQHSVLTGVALVDAARARECVDCAETQVWMRALEKELIDAYVSTGEPMDKAGAYGIQGKAALFVEKIEGCYFNVVGLPLSLLYLLLTRMDLKPWSGWRESDEQGGAAYH